ncbi:MAG: transposase domain-containing protein [Planctomyces sp.]|nr:transposase domain-containing protein [Planctomyces sp.]
MSGQGSSDLSPEVEKRILDRIAGLEKVIAPELVTQALEATDKQVTRDCKLNNQVVMSVVLCMGLFTDWPIGQVYKACRRMQHSEQTPARSTLCMARQRLGNVPTFVGSVFSASLGIPDRFLNCGGSVPTIAGYG